MPEYLSPGVYIEELTSGPRPIAGVSTSIAGMVGVTARGPLEGKPQLVTSLEGFHRVFGGFLQPSPTEITAADKDGIHWWLLPLAVKGFFDNGGQQLYVKRVPRPTANSTRAAATLTDAPPAPAPGAVILTATARQAGASGNSLHVALRLSRGASATVAAPPAAAPATTVKLTALGAVKDKDTLLLIPAATNDAPSVHTVVGAPDWANSTITLDRAPATAAVAEDKLFLVGFRLEIVETPPGVPPQTFLVPAASQAPAADLATLAAAVGADPNGLLTLGIGAAPLPPLSTLVPRIDQRGPIATAQLAGGADGAGSPTSADYTGTDGGSGKRTGIKALEDIDEISNCAVPGVCNADVLDGLNTHCEQLGDRFAVFDGHPKATIDDIKTFRASLSTDRAALYYPWLKVPDPAGNSSLEAPPSGHVIGVYAQTDLERGVHKAPANVVLRGIVPGAGFTADITRREQDTLNPVGINVLRAFPNLGQRVWGARTLADDTRWRYVNVRRLFLFIEESLDEGLQWVCFEPNTGALWESVRQTITSFLTSVWRSGALAGTVPEEAFYVVCDRTTMTEDDLALGQLVCQVGIAPVFPAEFVIVRIQQATRESIAS
ncbi:phage tail sheath family protein [Streptomyces yerevanensis]|uniref:phage tail sheath family protein n=1 Tax=Streptomyces yerevanensis TaxID=66378 RepID=UPI000527CDD4|nr:phage tail sheath subtilisin-like domain-containing protein [Streptomyces yerevanensis]